MHFFFLVFYYKKNIYLKIKGENLTIHVVIGGIMVIGGVIMVIYSKKMEQKKIDYEKLDNKEKITINNENEEGNFF